jgi:hypothetical protein
VPALTIDQPAGGTLVTRDRETYIDGSVDDPSINHVTVNGQDVMLVSGRFVHLCTLSEGVNAYNITVVDAAGNSNSTVVTITSDTKSPTYIVDLIPVGGRLVILGGTLYSTARAVDVHIVADETVVVDVAGNVSSPRGTDLWVRVGLREGQNDIALTLEDLAGNACTNYGKRVILDTTPPPIRITEPPVGMRTNDKDVVVFGRTDVGCNVTVGGTRVDLLPMGEFRLVVVLKEGRNDIRVESVDQVGNANSTVVSVDREGTGPVTGGMIYLGVMAGVVVVIVVVGVVLGVYMRRR